MSDFKRKFNVQDIEEILEAPENAWFQDLLGCWYPSGDRLHRTESQEQADHLRLAVRNGYLNFYRAGQSVANVRRIGCKLQAKVHKKYVLGQDAPGKDYILVCDGRYIAPDGAPVLYCEELLQKWIRAASNKTYVKEEKQFVDDLVAQNPGVIDLEAGLPWDAEIWPNKSAKRIDLVAIENSGDRYRLVFWEAKLVTNSEARSQTEPDVIKQLRNYRQWLEKHRQEVVHAYYDTCKALVRLHAIAKAKSPGILDLGDAVRAVARGDASELDLDATPRLIISDGKNDASFIGHLAKLQEKGFEVRMARDSTDMIL